MYTQEKNQKILNDVCSGEPKATGYPTITITNIISDLKYEISRAYNFNMDLKLKLDDFVGGDPDKLSAECLPSPSFYMNILSELVNDLRIANNLNDNQLSRFINII